MVEHKLKYTISLWRGGMTDPETPLSSVDQKSLIIEEANVWVILLNDPDTTNEERDAFKKWLELSDYHAECFDRAVSISCALSRLSNTDIAQAPFSKQEGPFTIGEQVRSHDLKPNNNSILRYSIAAAVAVLVLVSVMLTQIDIRTDAHVSMATHSTDVGQKIIFSLDDGSRVILGPDSHIRSQFTDEDRRVVLEKGVAFFDVVSDYERPFSVFAGELIATAIGTSFDVRNNGDFFRVGVAHGDVKVSFPVLVNEEKQPILANHLLTAGQEVAANKVSGLQDVKQHDVAEIAAWTNNQLIYHAAPIGEFIADLNRYSEIPIQIIENSDEVSSLTISGAYIGNDLDNLLVYISEIHDLTIDRSELNRIIIRQSTR